jgi:hypothetical protein
MISGSYYVERFLCFGLIHARKWSFGLLKEFFFYKKHLKSILDIVSDLQTKFYVIWRKKSFG